MVDEGGTLSAGKIDATQLLLDLQALQAECNQLIDIPIVLYDTAGKALTKPSHSCIFCSLLLQGEACPGCYQYLVRPRPALRKGENAMGTCPRTGLSLTAIPVMIDGVYFGSWVFGQIHMAHPARKTLKNIASTMNLSLVDTKHHIDSIPRLGAKELGHITGFMRAAHRVLTHLTNPDTLAATALASIEGGAVDE